MKSQLQYGSIIYLSYTDENMMEYFVTAEGFSNNKVRLKPKHDILNSSGLSSCLFKMYPTFFNNEFNKAKKKFDVIKKNKLITSLDKRQA